MNDADKPFIAYRQGRWDLKIVPRNAQGWREMIIWMLLMVPMVGALIAFASTGPKGTPLYIVMTLFMLGMVAWGVGGMLWMRGRSEVVNIEELLTLKRERDREAGKRRR